MLSACSHYCAGLHTLATPFVTVVLEEQPPLTVLPVSRTPNWSMERVNANSIGLEVTALTIEDLAACSAQHALVHMSAIVHAVRHMPALTWVIAVYTTK